MHKQFAQTYDALERISTEIMTMNVDLHNIALKAVHTVEVWRRSIDEFNCGNLTIEQTKIKYATYIDYCQEYGEKEAEIKKLEKAYNSLYREFREIRREYLGY